MTKRGLRVVIIKPSKYGSDGYVERFRWGFMPNSTLPHLRSMTPSTLDGRNVETYAIDEYVHTDLKYVNLLRPNKNQETLVALVGVQSHQLNRALDLAVLARNNECKVVVGGPHPMTCDTSMLQNRGISFALSEAEVSWLEILTDASRGELKPAYTGKRWQENLTSPIIVPPSRRELGRYIFPMLGLYPARGCPFNCSFCSVIKIAGQKIRSQTVETTIRSLRAAKRAGVRFIMFTSDNFNKYGDVRELLTQIIEENMNLSFFVQCDTQLAEQEDLIELLSRAGCFQIFIGVESFSRSTLMAARKGHNRPERYNTIVKLCDRYGISSHFSNIIGFPDQDEKDILESLECLKAVQPTWASFYILCPIPGTDQYQQFLNAGLITESNLDRFDTTCLTWTHPKIEKDKLESLLYEHYRQFFSGSQALTNVRKLNSRGKQLIFDTAARSAFAIFNRYSSRRRRHPMSGGFQKTRCDSVKDYLINRSRFFGFESAPLPNNLPALADASRSLT